MKITSINPYTEETNGEFNLLSHGECDRAVEKARKAFLHWSQISLYERLSHIEHVGSILRRDKVKFAGIITCEMGKPIRQATGEIEKCAVACNYYVEHAERFLADESFRTEAKQSFVTFEPLGVILGVMPWNFPFWQVLRFAIPTLAAGNVCLLKHASNVPISGLEVEKVFREAGLPEGVFQTLLIDANAVRHLIETDGVDGVSLTGSTGAGSSVGALAGKHIKKLVLELGGSDPFMVLEDADIEQAAETALWSRFLNAGQSCIAAKRLIVLESIAEPFTEALVRKLQTLKIGDPLDGETDIGPVAKKEFLEGLREQLNDAVQRGANVVYGPAPPSKGGFFFQPTVITKVNERMKVLREEVFGPIAPIRVVQNEEEALRIANDTEFGLGASIWSRNTDRALKISRRLSAGFVAINDMVKSDPRLPFGGVKKSGIGRELSHYGLREFVNIKTVVVR